MNCQRCVEYLSGYADGTLGARRSTLVREHLATCRRCRREYDELLRLRSLLGHLPAPTPRGDFWGRMYTTLGQRVEASRSQSQRTSGRRWPVWTTALQEYFAASVAPRAGLAGTTLAALALIAALALPSLLSAPGRSQHKQNQTVPAPSVRPGIAVSSATHTASAPVFDEAVGVDALVALHASHDSALPLADRGRMGYATSTALQSDLRDGFLDIR